MRILRERKRQERRYFRKLKTDRLGEDTGRKILKGTVGFFSNATVASPSRCVVPTRQLQKLAQTIFVASMT
jgi:hypothetical protein